MNLYEHQKRAIARYAHASFAPIFHSPGCGKSATTLRIVANRYLARECDAVLIIAPNRVHKQWASEQIPLWLSDIPFVTYVKKTGFIEGRLNIVCVNIEQFSTSVAYKKYVDWTLSHHTIVVLDEATCIKNIKSKRSQRLLRCFNEVHKRGRTTVSSSPLTVMRIALTGTPTTNAPTDVWAIFEFLCPSYFKLNYYAFQRMFCMMYSHYYQNHTIPSLLDRDAWEDVHNGKYVEGLSESDRQTILSQKSFQGPYKNLDFLKKKIQETGDIVSIEDVIDMPKQTYIVRHLTMCEEQARIYREMKETMCAVWHGHDVSALTKVGCVAKLQQISSGFVRYFDSAEGDVIPGWVEPNVRAEQLLADLDAMEEQVIVVTHFQAEAAKLYSLLEPLYPTCLQTGWKRIGTIEDFQSGRYRIMIANIRVLAFGFNLQNCHQMIFYSNTYSLEDRLQVEARIYRSGQKERCVYFDYVMDDTVDVPVLACLKNKQKLLDYIKAHDSDILL